MSARTVWAGERLERLKREFPTADLPKLAAEFGISVEALRQAAVYRGIRRDEKVISQLRRAAAMRGNRSVNRQRVVALNRVQRALLKQPPLAAVFREWVQQ